MALEVLCLGYVILGYGLRIEVIMNWPRLRTIIEVRSFHRFTVFYLRFIPHFNSIMAPMTDCMKGSRFQWTKETEESFQLIKVRLTIAPILELSDYPQHLSCIAMLRKWVLE